MTADRFVIKHLESINSNVKLFKSKQLRHNINTEQSEQDNQNNSPLKAYKGTKNVDTEILESHKDLSFNKLLKQLESDEATHKDSNRSENESDEQDVESDDRFEDSYGKEHGTDEVDYETDDSINAIENWKGKGKETQGNILVKNDKKHKKVHRKTKYMSPTKEIDRILSTRKTRSTTNSLLINGNKATPVILSKKRYLVQNTCPFDAVAVLITIAYTDHPKYQQFIEENINNDFLNFCKNLAKTGPTQSIYKTRVSLLQNIFKVDTGVTDINLINATCNVNFIVTSYLKNAPSAIESISCSKCSTSKIYYSPTIVLNFQNGFKSLEDDIKTYLEGKKLNCSNCSEVMSKSRQLMDHLFI